MSDDLHDANDRARRRVSRAHFVCQEATVSRVVASTGEVFVTLDAYDDGPVTWHSGGQVPIVGRRVMAATTDNGQVWAYPEERPAVFVGMIVAAAAGSTPGPGWDSIGSLVDEGYQLFKFNGDQENAL